MAKDKEQHKKGKSHNESHGDAQESDEDKVVDRREQAKAFMRALHAGEATEDQANSEGRQLNSGVGQELEITGATCGNCQYLEQQLNEALAKADEAEGLYKRMAADFENYRRRIDRERENYLKGAIKKVVEQLLPALDDMDRAQSSLSAQTSPEKLLESIQLVFNRLLLCLEQLGVKPLSSVGEHFNPQFHEPVQQIQTNEFPDGTVMQELRKGYALNDDVIRPSLVNVASNSDNENAEEDSDTSDTEDN